MLISACTHSLTLFPKDGKNFIYGTASEMGKKINIRKNGMDYTGTYVLNGGVNGRILAVSPNGDSIRCEFQYSGGSGIGTCKDSVGELYDLQIN